MGTHLGDYVAGEDRPKTFESARRRSDLSRSYSLAVDLIELRQGQGLTQQQLAERCGVAQSEISRIEHASIHPTDTTWERLASAVSAKVRMVRDTGGGADEPSFPSHLAEICFQAADLILDFEAQPSGLNADPTPVWAAELRLWKEERGTEEPMHWVSEATSTYLTEAAHQVRAVGVLLGAEVVTAALDPLVRAVLERAGRVKWILALNISPERRGARAGLEWGVSLSAYRRGIDWSGVPSETRKDWQTRVREHRAKLEVLFAVERPPSDPCNPESKPSTEMGEWVVAGEPYPNYVSNAEYALENDNTTRRQGAAWYDGLSGFSHPSVIFSREHRAVGVDGRVRYTYPFSDLEKSVRVAALGLLDAARYWMAYYGADPEGFQRRVDALEDRLNEISRDLSDSGCDDAARS